MSDLVTDTGATFSDCGKYRYDLWRLWDESKPTLTFIMLNPSTADAEENDPTIERCQRRAIKWGFGQLRVANLMAYRATNPKELIPLDRKVRIGPENMDYLRYAVKQAGQVICGWGKDGHLGSDLYIGGFARQIRVPLYALKINKDGTPQHPLYIPYSQKPIWFGGGDSE